MQRFDKFTSLARGEAQAFLRRKFLQQKFTPSLPLGHSKLIR